MRTTQNAIEECNRAWRALREMKSLEDIGMVLHYMVGALSYMAKAMMETYDKLEQIERKLSSASHRRPTM